MSKLKKYLVCPDCGGVGLVKERGKFNSPWTYDADCIMIVCPTCNEIVKFLTAEEDEHFKEVD